MRSMMAAVAAGLVGLAMGPASRAADTLTIGDKAPELSVSKWVKGEKLSGFEAGKVYVVEFWATWCGPCRTSIPHLTELQKKNPEVNFIGVSVWEDEPKGVEPFVKEMGDKMGYRVAMDDVPGDGTDGNKGKMAINWLKAAGENGIPSSFIIGKDGKVAWIGHPMSMDKPLEKIVAGTWDLAVATSERAEAKAASEAMMKVGAKLRPLMADRAKNAAKIVEILDKAMAENKALEKSFGPTKFSVLLAGDDKKAASEYGAKLVDGPFAENAQALNFIAWAIVDPDAKLKDDQRDVKLALLAAKKASELSGDKDPAILDTYALALYLNGDKAKAIEVEEKAIKLSEGDTSELKARLEMFRKGEKK